MSFCERQKGSLLYLQETGISVPHAFSTRLGGVSEGEFSSLNLGERCGDEPEHVRENFRRLCAALGVREERLVFSRQVHGKDIRIVRAADARPLFDPELPAADGLLSQEAGVALAIFVADCIPILLYDPVRVVIGACHCGWRGTAADLAGEMLRRMQTEFACSPTDVRAAIGPGISRCCFETDADVPEAMCAVLGAAEAAPFLDEGRDGKYHVDLKGINRALLLRAGLLPEHLAVSGECTMCRQEKFWSYRATKGRCGRQCAMILLPEKDC